MAEPAGNSYSEKFFQLFETKAGGVSLFKTQLYGQNGTTLYPIAVDALGNLGASSAYTLAYTGSDLTSVTRVSDGKVLTLTWVAGNLTAVSDWA